MSTVIPLRRTSLDFGKFLLDVREVTMPNRALTACFAFTAGILMSGHIDISVGLFGVLMILCTYCSQAVYNNIKDVEGDKVNAPERPLASGALSVTFAWSLMILLVLAGFSFAYLASPFLLFVNVGYILLGIIYSSYTKSRCMLSYGTLVTSHIVVPLFSGYLIFGSFDSKILLAVIFMFVTEVLAFSIKDYKDIEGDKKMGMKTLPIVFSPRKAAVVTYAGLCLPLLLVWIPWQLLSLSYLFLILYLVAGVIRYSYASRLISNPTPATVAGMLKNFRYVLLLQMVAWWFS